MDPRTRFPNPAFINETICQIGEILKQSPAKDIENNIKAGVTSMLTRLDMVSREEFDVQSAVLARTREKLALLEARLSELEKKPNSTPHNKWQSLSSKAGPCLA